MEVFDGRFDGYEDKQIIYIVIGGWDDIHRDIDTKFGKRTFYENRFMQPLGMYKNMNEAYGRGLLYLNSLIGDESHEYITPITKLSDDQGMIMGIDDNSKPINIYKWVQILWYYKDN